MTETNIYWANGESKKMINAYMKAQETFKYFWRELSWEYRRIVPALDLACVKIAFTQQIKEKETPKTEHMWINEINFDGYLIKGILINDPYELTNIKNGDHVEIPSNQISDWLFATQGKTYGGFTIQAMRSEMNTDELNEHDNAWGLNFGDFNHILVAYDQEEHPENLTEHPMSKNMKDSFIDFLKQYPNELTQTDELGYTLLHKETIAGNLSSIEVLLQAGANPNEQTNKGMRALDFAKQMDWKHIIPVLEQITK